MCPGCNVITICILYTYHLHVYFISLHHIANDDDDTPFPEIEMKSIFHLNLYIYCFCNSIIKSGNAEYPEGSKVVGLFGWRDYTLYKPNKEDGIECFYKLPDMKSLPDSYALGAVGRPG